MRELRSPLPRRVEPYIYWDDLPSRRLRPETWIGKPHWRGERTSADQAGQCTLGAQPEKPEMKATIFTAVLCTAVISQINTASAQYYGPIGGYYYYGSPAAVCCALTPVDLGWALTRSHPQEMSDLTLPCEWQTARSAASITTTDRCAAAGAGAFGRTCLLMWASTDEARSEKHSRGNAVTALAGSSSTAATSNARIPSSSTPRNGMTTFACPIWSRNSFARPAVAAEPMSDRCSRRRQWERKTAKRVR